MKCDWYRGLRKKCGKPSVGRLIAVGITEGTSLGNLCSTHYSLSSDEIDDGRLKGCRVEAAKPRRRNRRKK